MFGGTCSVEREVENIVLLISAADLDLLDLDLYGASGRLWFPLRSTSRDQLFLEKDQFSENNNPTSSIHLTPDPYCTRVWMLAGF